MIVRKFQTGHFSQTQEEYCWTQNNKNYAGR